MKKSKEEPRYEKIAYEIAKRVVSYQIEEGSKLRGRTLLASEFGVSSETIRKAMQLLSNIGVVEVRPRSGINVISRDSAKQYIEQYKKQHETNRLFTDTQELLNESERVNRMLEKHVKRLLETSKKDAFPFDYFTLKLNEEDKVVGETLSSLRFWNETHGLVMAVEQDGHLYQAPNPKMVLEIGMTLYILGDDTVKSKTLSLFGRDQ